MVRRRSLSKRDLPTFFLKVFVPIVVLGGGALALYFHFRSVKEGVPVNYFEDSYPAQNKECPVDAEPTQEAK
ncbi:MAG: hypothetical protein ACK5O7_04655 [Holosporales bacterium]